MTPGARPISPPAASGSTQALSLPPFRAEPLRPLHHRVHGHLAALLRAGEWPPGRPLPGEPALCPEFDRRELAARHLVDILRDRWGVEFSHADEYIEPTVADAATAARPGIAPGTPMFRLERMTYLPNGRVGEYRRAVMRGDIYRYRVELR
jgi:DNA-binding GntR family transcriptional regulator